MARIDRVAVTLNTSSEVVGYVANEEDGWRNYCGIDGCSTTATDFVDYITVGDALNQLVDHLTDDHGITP